MKQEVEKISEADKRKRRVESQQTREYAQGFEAFTTGDDCPYPIYSGPPRTSWWDGYYDAMFVKKYGKSWLSL